MAAMCLFRCLPLPNRSVANSSRTGHHSRGRHLAIPVAAALRKTHEGYVEDIKKAGAAALLGAALFLASPALAELNKYEAAAGGEFGNGSAQQYGEADLKGRDFHGQVLIVKHEIGA